VILILFYLKTETNVLLESTARNDGLDTRFERRVDDPTDLTEHLRVAVDPRHDGEVHGKLFDEDSRHSSTIQLFRALQTYTSPTEQISVKSRPNSQDGSRVRSKPPSVVQVLN